MNGKVTGDEIEALAERALANGQRDLASSLLAISGCVFAGSTGRMADHIVIFTRGELARLAAIAERRN